MLEIITRHPTNAVSATPLLFVHGILHGAWCYDTFFLPYFAQHGYHASALSLRGHAGSPKVGTFPLTGIHHYVEDVAQVADQLEREHGKRPVVIGHSMGGLIVQKFLEKYDAAGAVLLASVPVGGALGSLVKATLRHPISLTLATLTTDMKRHFVGNPKAVKWAFFSETMPDSELESYRQQMSNESVRAIFDLAIFNMPRPSRMKKVPMLVVHGATDTLFTDRDERQTATAYNADFVALEDTAHDLMLEANWQQAADAILSWLKKTL
jgi:pimeloyl-ACP methyl ester carboxylesterase